MNNFLGSIIMISLIALTCISCVQKSDVTDEELITIANNNYIQTILKGDLDSLMTFYSVDAILMPPGEEIVKGKEAIRDFWADGMKGVTVLEAVSVFDEILVFGDWAYSRGTFSGISQKTEEANPFTEKLYFSGLWYRDPNSSWKIARDMWHIGTSQ
jgi:ketosteroid isomerase-like protein